MAAGYAITDLMLENMLEVLQGGAGFAPYGYQLHLFTNNYTVIDGVAIGDMTEATFDGYTAAAMDISGWGSPSIAAHVASITATTPIEFDAGTGGPSETVYGYFITNIDSDLVWAESFATGQLVDPSGVYKITPSLKQKTCR